MVVLSASTIAPLIVIGFIIPFAVIEACRSFASKWIYKQKVDAVACNAKRKVAFYTNFSENASE